MTPAPPADRPTDITVVDTHYHRAGFAASHLLVENGAAAFIDVGTTHSQEHLLAALRQKGLQPDNVSHIILTHIHLDHAGGAGTLMQCCPNARLLVHPKGAPHMVDPEKLIAAAVSIYGAKRFDALYGEIAATDADRVEPVEDGFVLDFQGRELHFLDTPGHARHHCCIWDPASRVLFTGDTMGLAYPELQEPGKPPFLIPTTSPAAFDPDALEQSVRRLHRLSPSTFYLTHFGPVPAHDVSVASLLDQLARHADLARNRELPAHTDLCGRIRDIFYEAYRSVTGRSMDLDRFSGFLAEDIELNAQGLEIWAARQQRREGTAKSGA